MTKSIHYQVGVSLLSIAATTILFGSALPANAQDRSDPAPNETTSELVQPSIEEPVDDLIQIQDFSPECNNNNANFGRLECGNGAFATGSGSTAIGDNAIASDDDTVALGFTAQASGVSSIAIGRSAQSDGATSVAVGIRSEARQFESLAVGGFAIADSERGTAIGSRAQALGIGGVSIGARTLSETSGSIAIGSDGLDDDTDGAFAIADDAIAIGSDAGAGGVNAIAIGSGSTATFLNSAAFGAGISTERVGQFKFGNSLTTYTFSGIASSSARLLQGEIDGVLITDADGNLASDGGRLNARVTELENVVGSGGGFSEELLDAVIVAVDNNAGGIFELGNDLAETNEQVDQNTADIAQLDSRVDALEGEIIAVAELNGTGANSTAAGTGAIASGNNATALGDNAQASGEGSLALGADASAAYDGSTAIGASAETSRENQMALGTQATTYTAAGIASAQSQAAQGEIVGVITTDAQGNLASDGGALQAQVTSNQQELAVNTAAIALNEQAIAAQSQQLASFDLRLENFGLALGEQGRRLNRVENGLAAATAIPDAYLDSTESYAISGGFGVVGDEIGFGGSVMVRASDRWSFGASLGVSGGEAAGRIQFRLAN